MTTEDKTVKVTEEFEPDGSLTKKTKEYPPKKTISDWVGLIAQIAASIAVIVSIIALAIGVYQCKTQQSDSANQVLDQQRQTTLDTYLDRIQELLLTGNFNTNSDAQTLASARTFTVLRYLDGNRKAYLVRFLYDTYLMGYFDKNGSHPPVINVYGFDLSGADFATATLPPDLKGAILSYDNLNETNLSKADLSHADLTYALLQGATLSGANLSFADLSNAEYLTQQQLDQVSTCKGTILPKGLTCNHNQ